MIDGDELVPMHHPWFPSNYCEFKGKIKQTERNKYLSYGILTKIGEMHTMISELPVHKWTEDYESESAGLIANGYIKVHSI